MITLLVALKVPINRALPLGLIGDIILMGTLFSLIGGT